MARTKRRSPNATVQSAGPARAAPAGPDAPKRRAHTVAACGVLVVALALLWLSLSHLAAGVAIVTGSSERDSWLFAAGVDLGFVALEVALLVAGDDIRAAVERYAFPAVVATLGVSAAMNSLAFAMKAEGWLLYPAIGLGCAVPGLVYALTRVGAILVFSESGK